MTNGTGIPPAPAAAPGGWWRAAAARCRSPRPGRTGQSLQMVQDRMAREEGPPLMRFLTMGGAVVELRHRTFRTNHFDKYRTGDTWHEVTGFWWQCLGCGQDARNPRYDRPFLPDEKDDARSTANAHAGECRSMPREALS